MTPRPTLLIGSDGYFEQFDFDKAYGDKATSSVMVPGLVRTPLSRMGGVGEVLEKSDWSKEIELFSLSTCGASVIWDLYYFVIRQFEEHPDGQHLELGENIELKWVSHEETATLALEGSIKEDRSAAVLLRFLDASPQE
jgi:hypothetical protein